MRELIINCHVKFKIQVYMCFLLFIFVEISWIKIQIRGGRTARRVFYSVCLVFGLQIIHTVLEPRSHSALSPWHRGVCILESYHPMLSLIINGIHKWDSSGLHLVTTINRGRWQDTRYVGLRWSLLAMKALKKKKEFIWTVLDNTNYNFLWLLHI